MNLLDISSPGILGLGFVLLFFILMLVYAAISRRRPARNLRPIPAFAHLGRAIGLAVEAGERLHLSLGRGTLEGLQGGSAIIGLVMLQRIARATSISDRPPVATSGEGSLTILSQDTLHSAYRNIGALEQYSPLSGQFTGATPFSYAAGTLPVIYDQQVSANVLAGHFGSEVALITDAAERSGSMTLAGSDSLPAQAIMYATAQEPLIGEELYAGGAYLQAGPLHVASLHVEDIFRWLLVIFILAGAALKLVGAL